MTNVDQKSSELNGIEISTLEAGDFDKWDDYVMKHPQATFFHRSGWKRIIEHTLGHPAYYFYAQKDGKIVGVLPTGHIKSFLFGKSLISSPFSVYGGALADSDEIRDQLVQSACALAKRLKVDCFELRAREVEYPSWPTKDLYVTFRKEIVEDPEENMKAIPRKQRAMVRKGINAGLVSEVDEEIDRFFEAYSFSVWRLGTPVFPKRFFKALKEEFGDDCEILTVTLNGELVASVMNFYFRDEVLPYYGGGLDNARACKGNDFMYWEVMRRAAERGIKTFDYGRSKIDTGSYRFKKHWGFEPTPLPYQYYLVKAKEMPQINPNNPKYRMFIEGWKKMPVGMSRFIGPWLAKDLG